MDGAAIPIHSFARRALYALPVILAAALVIAATQSPQHAIALGALVFAAALVGPRLRVDNESQHVAAGVTLLPAMVLGLVLARAQPEASPRGGVLCVIATWSVLACASRLVMEKPAWGALSLVGFGSVAVLLSGFARMGSLYVGLSWGFVVACLGAMRASDRERPPLRRLSAREWGLAGLVALGTLSLSAGSAYGLPRLHDWLVQRFMRESADSASSGFSPWLELGPLRSMALSEEVVLRVRGRAPEYLRGMVYDRYERGRWRNTHSPASTVVRMARGPLAGDDVVAVERIGGISGWYFLPLEARDVATINGSVRRDALGTVRGVPGDAALDVWFRTGSRDALAPVPPSAADHDVPAGLRPTLDGFVTRWTRGALTDASRMNALRFHLRHDYRYSMEFERARGVDPVTDFLTRHREGHCEYFASTLALLGRSAGVATRVVGGYRVAEHNPLGGYHVVREKNAHAWVEAWVDGAWRSYDATPAGALPYNERHDGSWWRSASDFFTVRMAMARAWIVGQGTTALLVLASALLAAWLSWRARRARSGPREGGGANDLSMRALPCMDALTAALAGVGVVRAEAETLERFAARVRESELSERARGDAAAAIERYAALRYGAVGDEGEVAREVLRAASRVGSASVAP